MWVGGAASVDFVNTLRSRAVGPRETLTDPERLATWLSRAGLLTSSDAAVTEADLREARQLRAALDTVLVAPEQTDARTIDVVNRWAARHRGPLLRPAAGGAGATRLTAAPDPPTVRTALAALAAELVRLVESGDADTLRICTHDRCGIRFLDRSRGHNRRWCSMQRCGNRTKAARHARTARGTDPRE